MFDIRLRETLTRSTHGLFPSWIKAILSRSDPGENFLHKTISIIDHRFKYFEIFYFILILNFLFIINKKKRNR